MMFDWFLPAHFSALASLVRTAPEVVLPASMSLMALGYALARWRYSAKMDGQAQQLSFLEAVVKQLQWQLGRPSSGPGNEREAVAPTAQLASSPDEGRFIEIESTPTLSIDLVTGTDFLVTLKRHSTVGMPLNPRQGEFYLTVRQSDVPHTLSWNSVYIFPDGHAPSLSTRAGAVDVFRINSLGSAEGWQFHVAHLTPVRTASDVAAGITGQGALATMTMERAARELHLEMKRLGLLN